jgi:hypothetical protein
MNNCLCHPPTPPPGVPDVSRWFDAVRRAVFAEFVKTLVSGGYPIRQLATSHPQALGNLIPEAWAIVSEILAFYDVLIAKELFIGSATTRVIIRRLADLLGYLPQPSVASSARVALVGSQIEVPTSTQALVLRAALPFPQVFEPDEVKTLSWIPRSVTLAPIRDTSTTFDESSDTITLLLEATTAAPQRGSPVLFLSGYEMRATEILGVKASQELDGTDYIEIKVVNPSTFNADLDPNLLGDNVNILNVSILSPSQRAFPKTKLFGPSTPFKPTKEDFKFPAGALESIGFKPGGYGPQSLPAPGNSVDTTASFVELDGVYRSIKIADLVILQKGARFSPHRVISTIESFGHINGDDTQAQIPFTVLTLNPAVPAALNSNEDPDTVIIHYNFHDIGRLMKPAHSELTPQLIAAKGGTIDLEGHHRTPDPSPYPGKWLLEDANGRGALVDATMTMVGDRGKATLTITGSDEWTTPLRVPVVAHPNILHVTRGETVKDELLGSGDPRIPSQSFELKKSPLTYLPADTPEGIKSTLSVRVDGVLWHEVRTFYGTGPNDHVYIVRQDDDEKSTVTFGDGIRGSRLPAGLRNVRATYRFGAGAASPPFGNITQISRSVPGLTRVRNPVPASGGGDREDAINLRRNAPASALVLGRCVSLTDFGARVAGMPGVLNSKVALAWDEAMLSAVVKVWYISATVADDKPDPVLAAQIVENLQGYAEPGTLVQVEKAKRVKPIVPMRVEIAVDPDRSADEVCAAVHAALTASEAAIFNVRNALIGGPLSRSAVVAAVLAVPGVVDIITLTTFVKLPFPSPAYVLPTGSYIDLSGDHAADLLVAATTATQRDCCDLGS